MKHLKEFFNYIKESKSIDKEEVETMLLPIKDMGFRISYSEGVIISVNVRDKNHGKKYLKVHIDLSSLNRSDIIIDGYRTKEIDDNRLWEILDEIMSLRGRLMGEHIENCIIDFIIRENYFAISLILVGNKEEEKSDEFLLIELMSILKSKLNNMKTDFSYNTLVSLNNDNGEYSIDIKSNPYWYTDRKLNNLFRGIDMSRFNVNKYIGSNVINRITIKK
jgi:hypothetical protein